MASRYQIKEAVKILKEACNENFDMFKSELHKITFGLCALE